MKTAPEILEWVNRSIAEAESRLEGSNGSFVVELNLKPKLGFLNELRVFILGDLEVEKLARRFAELLSEHLTQAQKETILGRQIFLDKRFGRGIACATHDFMDSNQVMLDAIGENANDVSWDLIHKAWNLARENHFWWV